MTNTDYMVTIAVNVHDRAALRAAAERRYVSENRDPANAVTPPDKRKALLREWRSLRRSHGNPVAADLIMLFDPGASPPGIQIQETSAS